MPATDVTVGGEIVRGEARTAASLRAYLGFAAVLFAASAAMTIAWATQMSAMGEMPMARGWMRSMTWMPMPPASWSGTAVSFVGMWTAMMVAMMLPSVAPMLWRHRQAISRTGVRRVDRLTGLVGLGYFFVWTALGLAVFALGAAVTAIEVRSPSMARTVPIAIGTVVLIAGAVQFTTWKACHLACCRDLLLCGRTLPTDGVGAWRHGLHFGIHCAYCCASLVAILLVVGVMDLRLMTTVTAAITAERLAPHPARVARAIGVVAVAAGLLLLVRASGLG